MQLSLSIPTTTVSQHHHTPIWQPHGPCHMSIITLPAYSYNHNNVYTFTLLLDCTTYTIIAMPPYFHHRTFTASLLPHCRHRRHTATTALPKHLHNHRHTTIAIISVTLSSSLLLQSLHFHNHTHMPHTQIHSAINGKLLGGARWPAILDKHANQPMLHCFLEPKKLEECD